MNYFKKRPDSIVLVSIIVLSFILQFKYINEFPSFIHAWSQSDRYAIAIGFINNNFDFFHPESLIMNPQYPDWWETAYKTSITAVDFPINEYIIAIIMKLSGTTSPWTFRLFTLLYSLIGLFYLYKVARLLTNQFSKSILITFFAATSPVFVYYQSGFIPGITALSNVIIGIYLYLTYIKDKKIKYFYLSVFFLTLATLIRSSFAIPIVAVFSFEFLRIIKKETIIVTKILPVFLSVLSVISYYAWNSYLRQHYGSMFLNELLYPESIEQAKSLLSDAFFRWRFQYFSETHYWIFLFCLVVAIGFIIFNKIKRKNNPTTNNHLSLWIFNGIWLLGCILFSVAMLKQFTHHDYYFLDTFYLPLMFLFILILKIIPDFSNKKISLITGILVFLILIPLIVNGVNQQKSRRGYDERVCETISDFNGSAKFLDSLVVSKDAKILVINAYPQNTPFILMKRKGFVLMWPERDLILKVYNGIGIILFFKTHIFFMNSFIILIF